MDHGSESMADVAHELPAVNRLEAEFVDPQLEQDYLQQHVSEFARRLLFAGGVGSLICFSFCITDFAVLGNTPAAWTLFGWRLAQVCAAGGLGWWIHRDRRRVVRFGYISLVELITIAVFLVVVYHRPAELQVHNLSMALTTLALFLLIPNRLRWVGAVTAIGTVAYVVTVVSVTHEPLGPLGTQMMSLVVFWFVGYIMANQMQRARRDEYALLLAQVEANHRLQEEIDRRRDVEDELMWMAHHDALTDLYNRRAFFEQFDREVHRSRRNGMPISVLVMDADEFKLINDRFGHHTGDEALKRIAGVVRMQLRADDVVGRIGGEEFAVVMPATKLSLAEEVANRVCDAVNDIDLEHPLGPVRLTVSIGAAEVEVWNEQPPAALQRADEAMYRAKLEGRNRVVPAR